MHNISASGLAQRILGNAFLKPLPPPARSPALRGATISTTVTASRMESGGDGRFKDPGSIPEVAKLRQLVAGDVADGWENSWKDGVTPWDLGQPTPVISHLLETSTLPRGRVLIPGCGSGYDVVALASPERYVVGLDISESATKKAKEWSSSLPNSKFFSFLTADFFNWHPTESFDLIFDYTFFCAIDPCMRAAWASKMRDLLNSDGELITLIYPIGDHAGGPPYSVNVTNYEEVLNPVGFKALSIVDNDLAVQRRKGREKLGRWKRCASQSYL